ncbi:hypothetical protein DPMN_021487 [Dreissena polymorpha]|uniref:Uncharacterized protein n=1 Tax=Dreissena polymorpha TaxID=45954 RepID=A0A9D4SB40_DREPO|nr:hypothetical protein DPMN_021487 [Dreissena polymorpha]
MTDLIIIHNNDITPPQQYLLQVTRKDTPEPETSLCYDDVVRKNSVQVLLSSERFKQGEIHLYRNQEEAVRAGPSVSWVPGLDFVHAFHVCKPHPELQHWINRCRGRLWPPDRLLEAARVSPRLLVPTGHQDSDYNLEEWRLSPNLIERMLMFSFNITHIKCYIVLNLIKQSFF